MLIREKMKCENTGGPEKSVVTEECAYTLRPSRPQVSWGHQGHQAQALTQQRPLFHL